MASDRRYLVVEVDHGFHIDGVENSTYCATEEEAFNVAKIWKQDKTSILVYKCIAEAEIEQVQTIKIVAKD